MTYKIEQVEGIGPESGARLASVGIHTTDDLLARTTTLEDRQRLAYGTGLSMMSVTAWRHQADLMRISGIGSEYGQLLEVAGIESVRELAMRKPENIVNLLDRVNAERKLTRSLPALKLVSRWVEQAQQLEPEMAH